MVDEAWYVVHAKPRKEQQVYRYLSSKNIHVFFPTIRVKPVNPRASKVRPYFPRYLFARVNPEEVGLSTLQWIPGAVGLVEFDGEPAIVPDHVMQELQRRVAELKVELDTCLSGLKPGDKVRVTKGAFAGYEAIFDGRLNGEERAQILVDWLGRRVKVAVDGDII